LLHLDQGERVRLALQKIANSCDRQLQPLVAAVNDARVNLLRALELTEFTAEKVLAAANAQRNVLGLAPLTELSATTSLKDGIASPKPSQASHVARGQALADIKAARDALTELTATSTANIVRAVVADLAALASDPAVQLDVKREDFYSLGIDLLDDQQCPFCDIAWDLNELRRHVQAKIANLKAVAEKRAAAEKRIWPLIAALQKVRGALDVLAGYGMKTVPRISTQKISEYAGACKKSADTLRIFLPLSDSLKVLETMTAVPQDVYDEIAKAEALISGLPEPTKQDAARDWLTLAQERLEVWREAMRKRDAAKARAARARQISDIYAKTSDAVLAALYVDVEDDFAKLYSFVNRDDEDAFKAKLVPSMGKLGFDVDFYGRGFFPPGAYHSEGHQDAMGLCLYLALMRHLYGSGFTFTVLDDVLMSVDAGHRREVCSLMKREFPNTQFILTTHDPIWLRHMKTEGVLDSRSGVQFRCWDVEEGPTCWDDRDVWTEIDDHLSNNDVRAAAALLRHYLEYISGELCHRLRAPVEFRADARYQLGELLPPAVSRMRKLYAKAKEAASSWNQKDVVEQIAARASVFSELVAKSNVEQWQINSAVHFNAWDNLQKADFASVVEAFRELLAGFCCSSCNDYLRVSPERERIEALRCYCGKTNINLCKKGA
jgi:hypothetical protein